EATGAGAGSSAMRTRMIAAFLSLGLTVVWGLWGFGQLTGESGVAWRAIFSLLVVLLVPVGTRIVDRIIEGGPAIGQTGATAVSMLPTTAVRALGAATTQRSLRRIIQAAMVIAALWLLLRIWQVDPTAGDGPTAAVLRIILQGGVVAIVGFVLWTGVRGWIDRQIVAARTAPPSSSMARIATMLPLVRAFLLIAIAVIVLLSALSSFGIAIGPLLAGAGVIGLAIGFGAQSLVRDIVSGFFFLLDDAFRVGEYVDTGKLKGTVESISLRSIKLRHHRGAVHTVAFGTIDSLTNYSRDWVVEKLEFGVALDSDVEQLAKVVKQVGRTLAADPDSSEGLLDAPKFKGIGRITDYALIISVKFMAKPGQQFAIRRETYRRVVEAFKANGIRLASPSISINRGDGREEATAAELAAAHRHAAPPPSTT
ncbi:MAG: mechanosensitive ion channel family protein, partial [Azospirillaceae bacterium]